MHNYRGKRTKTHKKNYQVGGVPEQVLSNRSMAKAAAPAYNPFTQPFGPTTSFGPKVLQPEEMIEIKDSKGLKSGRYPKKHIEGIVRASQEVGVDPAAAVALALQESNLGTAITKGRRGVRQADLGQVNQFSDAQQQQLSETSQRTGIGSDYLKMTMALKDKLDYANRLGFTDEASQYQAYNGYGVLTRDKFGGADKAYGVPIGEGIDMRKNPLYGKRIVGLKSDIAGNREIDEIIKRPLSPQIMNYGGRKQRGGLLYDQQYNDEKIQQRMQAGQARMLMTPQPDLSYNPMNPQFGNQLATSTQANINDGSQFQNPNQPTLDNDWMTPLGIGLMGSRGVLSEISGRVARKRQDNYDATQQLMFNRQGEVNLNDYQPSPYSLYAKYGGKLRNYMPEFNNNAQMRMDRQMGGQMEHGGNLAMAPYHDLPIDEYNMIMVQQQVPEGFHLMPDGTLMPDNQMYRGGGLSRERNYGSKKKPYPSVKSSDFAGGNRSYPIPTKADAIDALRLAGLHGRSDVRAKVYKKYPELRK